MAVSVMTQAEYARARGITRGRVSQLKTAGRLVMTTDGKVDVDATDQLLAAVQHPTRGGDRTGARERQVSEAIAQALGDDDVAPVDQANAYDIKLARAKREHHEANLAEMRERKESGELVERKGVEHASVDAGATLRNALEQLPGKVGAQLAAEADPVKCRQLLVKEIDHALADVIENLGRVAGAA